MILEEYRISNRQDYQTLPHVSLASHIAGDVMPYYILGVKPDNIWLVEKDSDESESLERLMNYGVRLFEENIVNVAARYQYKQSFASWFYDGMGSLANDIEVKNIRTVVGGMKTRTIFHCTFHRGRDGRSGVNDDREKEMDDIVRGSACNGLAHHMQSVVYQSESLESKGCPMITMTYMIASGKNPTLSEIGRYIDIRHLSDKECLSLVSRKMEEIDFDVNQLLPFVNSTIETFIQTMENNMTTEAANKAWETRRKNAKKRSKAAKKAWKTRKENA